jgi:hypothetical protein
MFSWKSTTRPASVARPLRSGRTSVVLGGRPTRNSNTTSKVSADVTDSVWPRFGKYSFWAPTIWRVCEPSPQMASVRRPPGGLADVAPS